jgi:hypothetical protein
VFTEFQIGSYTGPDEFSPHPCKLFLSYECYLRLTLPSGPLSSDFQTGFCITIFLLATIRATCPISFIVLHLIIVITCGVKFKLSRLSLRKFIHPLVISSAIYFLNTLTVCLPQAKNHVSHPYRRAHAIIRLHIFIIKFLNMRWDDKRFWNELWKAFPKFHLHLSFLNLSWYVILAPKYFCRFYIKKFISGSNCESKKVYMEVLPRIWNPTLP